MMSPKSFYMRANCRRAGRRRGQGLAEVAATLAALTPIVLILIDCFVIGIGAAVNDTICRDAARAAASGPPGLSAVSSNRTVNPGESPYKRAVSVAKRVHDTRLPMKVRDVLKVKETVKDVPPATMGGAIDGEMNVETTIDVYPPFLVGAMIGDAGVSLKAKHVVAITYVLPAS